MILFLFLACQEPDCGEDEAQPVTQWNVPQMHSTGGSFETGEPLDTAYDTGGE